MIDDLFLMGPDEADSVLIEEWLANRDADPIIPASTDFKHFKWAHENAEAWGMVDLPDGLSKSDALSLMRDAVQRDGQSRGRGE